MDDMQLTSPDFMSGGKIPERCTCDGGDHSPELHIGGIPEGTRSFVLVLDDPDAPSGTFTHWVVWNIPVTDKIVSDKLPDGSIVGLNSARTNTYVGPCPPKGTHNYIFTLYALDSIINSLDPVITDKKSIFDAMTGHIIATAELVGLYCRKENR